MKALYMPLWTFSLSRTKNPMKQLMMMGKFLFIEYDIES